MSAGYAGHMTRSTILFLALTPLAACGDDGVDETADAAARDAFAPSSDAAPAPDDDGGPADAGALEPVLVVDADFEGSTLGEGCGGEDGFDESFSLSVRDDAHVFRGEAACRLGVPEGRNGFGSFGGIIDGKLGELEKGDEIWIRLALYVPGDYVFNDGRSKFIRLRTFAADGGDSRGYLDWYLASRDDSQPHHWIYEGTHRWSRAGGPEHQIVRDAWETYEIYYRLDETPVSEGGEGRVRFWKNGELLADIEDQRTLVEATDVARGLLIFTYFGNEGSPRDQSVWIDDLQVAVEEPPLRDAAGNPFLGG